MGRGLTLLFLVFHLAGFAQEAWLVDPLHAIYPDRNETKKLSTSYQAHFPDNTIADVHILLNVPPGQTITCEALYNNQSIGQFSQLLDVPVEQNTGLDSRTEQFIGQTNPHVIRRAPFRVFEIIKPLSGNEVYSTVTFTALRLEVPVSELNMGDNQIDIRIQGNGWDVSLDFEVTRHTVTLPKLEESQFFYTNWFNLTRMEEFHGVERWTDEWFTILDKYAAVMAHGRQNSITLPGELLTYENGIIHFDRDNMLRFIEVFRNHGFRYYESPHLLNRGPGDDWGDPELKVALTGRRYYQENGSGDIREIAKIFGDFAKKNNLTDGWLQHIADEPTAVQARCYSDAADMVRSVFPEAQIMEATNDRDSIVGAIDIWCPLINDFQENESFFREREAEGEKVLVYTCLIPGGKWLNRTLDQERLRQVYFGWGAIHYGTSGYLHWGLNQYKGNPFEYSAVKHPSPVATPNNYLPAGDTHVIYPGENGPLSSVRFEAHRIGAEDYEMLYQLQKKDAGLAEKLTSKLFNSYTDYSTSIKAYRKVKQKLLRSLN